MTQPPPPDDATHSRDGWVLGMRAMIPFLPGILVFGASFGALAAQKGLTLAQTLAMSGLVFAGASQLVALQLWTEHWTIGALAAVAGVVAAVNSRLLLMSAAFRPWLGPLPAATVYPHLLLLTDVNWAIGISHRRGGGRDFGIVAGAGVFSWLLWMVTSLAGFLLGGLVADPKAWGLDLIIIFIFAALAVPAVRRAKRLLPFAAAAAVSAAVSLIDPGYWFIIGGALAGALTAFAQDGDD